MLRWLRDEAARAARRPPVVAGPAVAGHWQDRAAATAAVLGAATEVIHAG
jgi:hypothetical protein